jgi:hypothetical protein
MSTIFYRGTHAAPPDRRVAARRALRRAFRLRARSAADDARPERPSPEPAPGAVRYQPRHRPGSAGLPAIDPATLAHLRAAVTAPLAVTSEMPALTGGERP